jgi:hypothetical protein
MATNGPVLKQINKSGNWSISQTLNVLQSELAHKGQLAMTQVWPEMSGHAQITGRSSALQYRLVCQASIRRCHISLPTAHSLGSMPAPLQLCTSWI